MFKSLNRYLSISAGGHALIAAVSFLVFMFFKANIEKIRESNVKLLESSVRVDMVSMPKMTLKELKTLTLDNPPEEFKGEKEAVAPEQKNETAAVNQDEVVFKKEAEKKDFKSFLKELGKKVSTKNAAKGNPKSPKIDTEFRENMKNLALAGNKLSEGRAVVQGTGTNSNATEFSNYLWSLPDHVRPYWLLPSYLREGNYRCRIRVYLGRNGELLKATIFETSGNDEFDQRSLSAVEKASPFPLPPTALTAKVINGDIVLGFPL